MGGRRSRRRPEGSLAGRGCKPEDFEQPLQKRKCH